MRIGIHLGQASGSTPLDPGMPPHHLSQPRAPCQQHPAWHTVNSVTRDCDCHHSSDHRNAAQGGAVCPRSHGSETGVAADTGLFWLPAPLWQAVILKASRLFPRSQVTETNAPRPLSYLNEARSKKRFPGTCSGGHAHRVCVKSQLQRAEAGCSQCAAW